MMPVVISILAYQAGRSLPGYILKILGEIIINSTTY
ncbi:hypothetical protein SAMN04489723_107157 [Algoriphagus aquimarinus]|uniref:Uncharacterized protein n=1 Tax=Algoriphagus aquimarinus TaxID=237018 RepID=A0A1I1A3F4_9BACT|nr:hypothetical protein SAMN04489723_107157 [Algoriphagus aquimarinus]